MSTLKNQKMIKLSLVAAVALAGLKTSAEVSVLEEAIRQIKPNKIKGK